MVLEQVEHLVYVQPSNDTRSVTVIAPATVEEVEAPLSVQPDIEPSSIAAV